MKTKILITTLLTMSATSLSAVPLSTDTNEPSSSSRDSLFSIYGISSKTNKDQNSSNGLGLYYNSEITKVKLEGTSDFVKLGSVFKFNPFTKNFYTKLGLNYIDQKMYATDNSTKRVNQSSGALAFGYLIQDDLYIELGGSSTKLNGGTIGTAYTLADETTNRYYLELAKRFETSAGTFDVSINGGTIDKELATDESSYGGAIDYYPNKHTKLGYIHSNTKDNIVNKVSVNYGYLVAEYTDNTSQKTNQINLGLQLAFDSLFDFSSYKKPSNIKPHLSELHQFEEMTMGANMTIQSSGGVSAIPVATPVVISTPTISIADITIDDDGGWSVRTVTTPTVSGVEAGAVYALVSDLTSGMLTINSSTGAMTWYGDVVASGPGSFVTFIVTVKVTNSDGGTATTTFNLSVEDIL